VSKWETVKVTNSFKNAKD